MSSFSETYIKEIVTEVAEKECLQNWNIEMKSFGTIGQNYFGVIIPATLTGNVDAKTISIYIVFKLAPNDIRFRVSGAITIMFNREIYFYDTIMKKYQIIQKTLPSDLTYVTPNCYYARDEYCKEAIVLEDMTVKGYKPYTTAFLDFDHIQLSVKTIAKLHALSFILKNNDRAAYDEMEKVCVPLNNDNNRRFMEILNDRLTKAIDKFNGTEYVSMLQHFQENLIQIVEKAVTDSKETALCHGDIWKENILYKYEDTKPVSACVIDYQDLRIRSPAYDFLYLITSSTASELRRHQFWNLFEDYYSTLCKVLEASSVPVHYSKEEFRADLNVVAPACFIIANTAIWLYSGLQEEGHVKSKVTFASDNERAQAVEMYISRIQGIIEDFKFLGLMK